MTENRKIANESQMRSFYHVTIDEGTGAGKRCLLVHNGKVEALFAKDNALDIVYLRYAGVNLSFLSKNGINSITDPFNARFEGGFLYTCGIDNLGGCVEGKITHGSLHMKKCDGVYAFIDGENIKVKGVVSDTELFGKNIKLYREYTVKPDGIEINDTIANEGYGDGEYAILYHINFGYPFLDECMKLDFDCAECVGRTDIARSRIADAERITAPVDLGEEDVFYRIMRSGRVKLTNENVGIAAELRYSTEQFPYTVEWKSMISGDYALGIEPSTSRLDDLYEVKPIKAGERVEKRITVKLSEV